MTSCTHRVRLVHWKAAEAEQLAEKLRTAGYDVEHEPLEPGSFRELRQNPPDAVVIDLTRLPSQGRDVALMLRASKATQHTPLVFVEGDPEKVKRVRSQLPDAVYTSWRRIRGDLKRAIARPPSDPVKPPSVMAGYSGTPLPKKLGIKSGMVVAMIDAPDDFEKTLGTLPASVTLRDTARGNRDLTLWFTRSNKDLERRIDRLAAQVGDGGLWIVWPKRTSNIASDLTQQQVRKVGLAAGLVDYKICAVDRTWSGLKFTTRKLR